jgi:hypothetical protein
MTDPDPNAPNDVPFDRETPFLTLEEEVAAARDIIQRDLIEWVLDERDLQAQDEVTSPFVSPAIEAIREYYGQESPPDWPDQVEEQYRIYRVYPIFLVSRADDPSYSRHAAVAYRLGENGVPEGRVYGFEA